MSICGLIAPRLAIAVLVPVVLGIIMMAWSWNLLGGARYAGVPTTRVLFSYRADTTVGEITSGTTIEQSLLATEDYLSQVDINMGTYFRRNTQTVVFALEDEEGNTVRALEERPETIADNQYHAFQFEPIPDSAGRRFVATLTSPKGSAGNAFTAWAGDCNCYEDGALFVNGVEQLDSDLSMRASYTRPDVVVWRELLDRMSQYKPLIFKGVGLVLVGTIASLLSLAALGVISFDAQRRAMEEMRPRYLWLAASIIAVVIVMLITTPYSY